MSIFGSKRLSPSPVSGAAQSTTLNVLYCVDDGAKAREWLEVSIRSLLEHADCPIRVFVASDAPYEREGAVWLDARPYINRFGFDKVHLLRQHGIFRSPMQFFRIAAPWLDELKAVDTLLYLDIDTEVVGPGLGALPRGYFDADAMAVFEETELGYSFVNHVLGDRELLNLTPMTSLQRLKAGDYFNSGVMLMNLARLRSVHAEWREKMPDMVEAAVRHTRGLVDQDILNCILDVVPLDRKYNTMPDLRNPIISPEPCIVHYAGRTKVECAEYPPKFLRRMATDHTTEEGKVDVLYVVGDGAADIDNRPLRWSLRALERFASNVGRVIVAGKPPRWLNSEAVWVNCGDRGRGKHWNILRCIEAAVDKLNLDRPFLYSSDDHYLCRPADMAAWPRFSRGQLYTFNEVVKRDRKIPGSYQMSIIATRRLVDSEGLSRRMACCHLNTWMDGADMKEVRALADTHKSFTPFGFEPTCLFNAVFEKRHPDGRYCEISDAQDSKVNCAADAERKIADGAPAFSSSPQAEKNPEFVQWMDDFLPDKSRYEV